MTKEQYALDHSRDWGCSNKTHVLDLKQKRWFHIANLNHAREHHSSFCIEDYVFVICGDQDFSKLNSIEMLDYRYSSMRVWELIVLDTVTPRYCPVACPLTENRILIMGGYDGQNYLKDAHVIEFKERGLV